jgi:hypothetical protein
MSLYALKSKAIPVIDRAKRTGTRNRHTTGPFLRNRVNNIARGDPENHHKITELKNKIATLRALEKMLNTGKALITLAEETGTNPVTTREHGK